MFNTQWDSFIKPRAEIDFASIIALDFYYVYELLSLANSQSHARKLALFIYFL